MDKTSNQYPIHLLTIVALTAGLRNMGRIMDKAEQYASSRDIALENFLGARLCPDMFNLLQQIQYVCYLAVDFARHFSDEAAPRVGYDETTWKQLRESLDTAVGYLEAITPQRLTELSGKIVPTFMDDSKGMTALHYAAGVSIPDFHFHMVVAYALLRHNGVPLGKSDYLGELDMSDIATTAS